MVVIAINLKTQHRCRVTLQETTTVSDEDIVRGSNLTGFKLSAHW